MTIELIACALSAYCITFVASSSSLAEPARIWCVSKTPFLKIGSGKHMLECRMCMGFWSSVLVCLYSGNMSLVLPVYGLSYFMATQER